MGDLVAKVMNKDGKYCITAVPYGIGLPIDTVQEVVYEDGGKNQYRFVLKDASDVIDSNIGELKDCVEMLLNHIHCSCYYITSGETCNYCYAKSILKKLK